MAVTGVYMNPAWMMPKTTIEPSGQDTSVSFTDVLNAQLTSGNGADVQPGMTDISGAMSTQAYLATMNPGNNGLAAMLMAMMLSGSGSKSIGTMMMSMSRVFSSMDGTGASMASVFQSASDIRSSGNPYATGPIDANADNCIPYAAGLPVNPLITSGPMSRSPELYNRVIGQFEVETNGRYAVNKQGKNDTYCNIFMWDVTRAMGAEIPHYVDPETNAPMYYPDNEGARHMNANRIYDWLHAHGEKYGWVEVTAEQAQMMANEGKPVVTAKRNNSGGHGHVQVVCPSRDGLYDPKRGVTVAQAGRTLTSYIPITRIYNASLPKVKYFAHI